MIYIKQTAENPNLGDSTSYVFVYVPNIIQIMLKNSSKLKSKIIKTFFIQQCIPNRALISTESIQTGFAK